MYLKLRDGKRRPKGGWWRGEWENQPGRYVAEVALAGSYSIEKGMFRDNPANSTWSGMACFMGDKKRVEVAAFDIAWLCRYKPGPGAEARCRTATDKAVAALQAYYDRTGSRWEVLREKAQRKGEAPPRLPPKA